MILGKSANSSAQPDDTVDILCETSCDFKYSQIFSHLDHINLIEGTYPQLMARLLSKQSIYHIRYIKYRGLFSVPRMLFLVVAIHQKKSRLVWTCHNIYEHNIPSGATNRVLRHILEIFADDIIVFHPDLAAHLSRHAQSKIHIANFGSFLEHFQNKTKTNPVFQSQYSRWLDDNNITSPQIALISAAKRQRTELLIQASQTFDYSTLVISPKNPPPGNLDLKTNKIFYFHDSLVEKEVYDILSTDAPIVGFIGHENISVPTSIYMFASFGIPMIGVDASPVNSLFKQYRIGETTTNADDFHRSYQNIQNNYETYRRNCYKFLKNQTWAKSARVHRDVFVLASPPKKARPQGKLV